MPAPEKHAVLSASSAERWLHCPGSVSVTKDLPDRTTEDAEKGRLAHAIAELKLRKIFLEPMGPKKYSTRLTKLKKDPHYEAEMDGNTDQYVEYINELAMRMDSRPFIAVEKRVDFSSVAPGGFGTSDCIMIHGKDLHVIDYKNGAGVPVEVQGNPQLMLYAFGALYEYSMVYEIETVHMAIVQPRAGGIKEAEISAVDLTDWATFTVRPVAKEAYDGSDHFAPGDWCRFCKIKSTCTARANACLRAKEDFGAPKAAPHTLSDEQVGKALAIAEELKRWAEDLKKYAENAMLDGKKIPGWKLVAGRSTRAWDDQEAAFIDLKAGGIDEAILYERKPLTLAAIEKAIGAKTFNELASRHVIKPLGKPTVVPETDSRPEYSQNRAEEDFAPAVL